MANSTVRFDENGDGIARYTIYNYKQNETTGNYDYEVNCNLFLYQNVTRCHIIFVTGYRKMETGSGHGS